jgi:hypothetical protein
MAENRANLLRLRIKIDERDAKEAAKLVNDIQEELADLARIEQLNNRVADAYEQQVREQNKAIKAQADAFDDLASSARRAGDAKEGVNNIEVGRQAIGDFSTTFGAASSVLGGSSGLGGAFGGVGDILGLVEYLPVAAQGLTALSPPLLALTAGAGLLTLGVSAVTSEIQKNIETENKRLEALREVAEVLVTATQGEVQARIDALVQQNQIEEAHIRLIEERTGRDREYLAELNDISLDNASAVQTTIQAIDLFGNKLTGAAAQIDQSGEKVKENNFLIDVLTDLLEDNATATNDASAAIEESVRLNEELTEALRKRGLEEQQQLKQLISGETDELFKNLEAQGKAREEINTLNAKAIQIELDASAKIEEIRTDANERRADIEQDAADRRTDIEQKSADDRYKIIRDFNRSYGQAVAERDALAAVQAKQNADDRLEDQKKAETDAQKALDKSLAKQNDTIQKSLDKQLRSIETAKRKESDTVARALLEQQIALQNNVNTERSIRESQMNLRIVQAMQEQVLLTGRYESMYNIMDLYLSAMVSRTQTAMQSIYNYINSGMSVNGVNPGSPAAYDLYGMTVPQTQAVRSIVNDQLNYTLQRSGVSSPR